MAMDKVLRAQKHIADIRASKGVDEPKHLSIVDDLQKLLNTVSDELYRKPAHFLLEFIQNADDNEYDMGVVPSLELSITPGHMEFSCNEKGFSEKNVEAICSVGKSTKKDRMRGFIGEKGIGFKSVFKIADVIWLSSGPYSFKFDKEKQLGMIAPIWAPYPEMTKPGCTQFSLDLSPHCDQEYLCRQLEDFHPIVLLFLRRLEQIAIKISRIQDPTTHVFTFQRTRGNDGIIGISQTGSNGVHSTRYIVVRKTVRELPKEKKREGVSMTEAVLAFPVDEENRPIIRSQEAYAFLPICRTNLRFLVQADFLLTADRGNIIAGSPWNDCLEGGLAKAFRAAINNFNQSDTLRYTWPHFLPENPHRYSDFGKLKNGILQDLRDQPILYSDENSLEAPISLMHVPMEYRDGEFIPFTKESRNGSRYEYLSWSYCESVENLFRLGVREMDFDIFLTELIFLISLNARGFQEKPHSWHSALARLLCKFLNLYRREISGLPLIPLRDGRWVAANEGKFYSDIESLPVPEGIDVCLLSPVIRGRDRRRLFKELGVRECDVGVICESILDLHRKPTRPELSRAALVDHAVYLFKACVKGVPITGLANCFWLVSTSGYVGRAEDLYIAIPGQPSPISKYSHDKSSGIYLIHKDYLRAVRGKGKNNWFQWLTESLKVSSRLKLLKGNETSPEFDFLLERKTMDLLHILKGDWDHYRPVLTRSMGNQICWHLSHAPVKCQDGIRRPLNETVLPRTHFKKEAHYLPYIDVEDPNEPTWQEFDLFGVVTRPDWKFQIYRLSALRNLKQAPQPWPNIRKIYELLQEYCPIKKSEIQFYFKANPLIYIATDRKWVSRDCCVWSSGVELRRYHILKTHYPSCKFLFSECLGIKGLASSHIISELLQLSPKPADVTFIKALLALIGSQRRYPSDLEELKAAKVIPIRTPGGNSITYDCINSTNWFLADRLSLSRSFDGRLPLADFTVEESKRLKSLWKAFGAEDHLLSEVVEEDTYYEDGLSPILDDDITLRFRAKVSLFLQSLNRDPQQMQQLEIFGVSGIVLERWVHYEGRKVYGKEDSGRAIFDDSDSRLTIYLLHTDLQSNSLPNDRLVEEFIQYCGISKEYESLLWKVLTTYCRTPEEESMYVTAILERHGCDVPDLPRALSTFSPISTRALSIPRTPERSCLPAERPFSVPNIFRKSSVLQIQQQNSAPNRRPSSQSHPTTILNLGAVTRTPRSSIRERVPNLDENIRDLTAEAKNYGLGRAKLLAPTNFNPSASGHQATSHSLPAEIISAPSTGSSFSPTPTKGYALFRRQSMTSDDPFNMEALRSTLSSTADITPSRAPRSRNTNPPTFHPSISLGDDCDDDDGPFGASSTGLQHSVHQLIGLLGEVYVHGALIDLLPDFRTDAHWTSRNRNQAFPNKPGFTGKEKEYADFTYKDDQGALTRFLMDKGLKNAEELLKTSPAYHLEVKSTEGPCNEPFFMSNNQLEMARRYSNTFTDVYVVIRVYHLNDAAKTPELKFYVDPWGLWMSMGLRFTAREGYVVSSRPE